LFHVEDVIRSYPILSVAKNRFKGFIRFSILSESSRTIGVELRTMPYKLSVITPVFNGVRFIEFCIRNVIEQSCPDVEHIIIDGGSNDGTVDIIKLYADKFPHIRWISEKDRGQSDAMNKGIKMASGEILGFLNVDDFYEASALREAIDMFRALPEPALLVGNCNVWDDNGNLLCVNKPSKVSLLTLLMLYVPAFPANPSAYFYHKSLHEKIGLYEVEEHYGMDVHFLYRATQAAKVKYVDKMWGNYRFLADTKTYMDVESGQNRIRVTEIADYYRKQAPVHHRIMSLLFIRLVNGYKKLLKFVNGE
jgi:glycosyltransferase involved in cell wall biosynthesis